MHNLLAQATYEELLNILRKGINDKNIEYFKALRQFRDVLVKQEDCLIYLIVEGKEILVNLNHNFPLYRAMYPLYDTAISRVCKHLRSIYGNLKMIDVGANVGDTMLMASPSGTDKVLCVEGSDKYYEILRMNIQRWGMQGNVITERKMLGEREEIIHGELQTQEGTGYIKEDSGAYALEIYPLDYVSKERKFNKCNLLKIDTDGFDNSVLRGSAQLLEREHPLIFFEFVPQMLIDNKEDPYSIFDFLGKLGYTNFLVYSNYGQPMGEADLRVRENYEYILGKIDGIKLAYYDILACHKTEQPHFKAFSQAEAEVARCFFSKTTEKKQQA